MSHAQEPSTRSPAAQTAEKLGTLGPQERIDLVAKLDDTQVRELILHYLSQIAPAASPQKGPEDLFKDLEQRGALVRANSIETLKSFSQLPVTLAAAHRKLTAGSGVAGYLTVVVALLVLIAAGTAVEWLYRLAVRRLRYKLDAIVNRGGEGWLRTTIAILFLDLVGVAIFMAGYVVAFLAIWEGNAARRQFAAGVLVGILVVRVTRSVALALLGPESAGVRLVPVTKTGARHLYQAANRAALAGVVLILPAYLLGFWSGDPHVRLLLMGIAGLVFSAYAAVQVWNARGYVAEAFLSTNGPPVAWPLRVLAYAWAPLLIAYIAAVYFLAAVSALAGVPIGIGRAAAALLVMLIVLPLLDRTLGLIFEARRTADSDAKTVGVPEIVLRRAARIALVVGTVLLILGIFGLGSVATSSIGAWLIRLTFDIGLVILIAYVLRELAITWISRRLAKEMAPGGTSAKSSVDLVQASRLKTILPLIQRALEVAIVTIAILTILSALGVNVAPLLAGAGVIGLAVGFGSQTLIKDLISGLFFLLDDAFRVGEVHRNRGIWR